MPPIEKLWGKILLLLIGLHSLLQFRSTAPGKIRITASNLIYSSYLGINIILHSRWERFIYIDKNMKLKFVVKTAIIISNY